MLKTFRTYHLSLDFYRQCKSVELPYHLKEQLLRSASSIVLNLAEGRGKHTQKEQLRFFHIAMGSARESQAALMLADLEDSEMWKMLDRVTASLYKLIHNAR